MTTSIELRLILMRRYNAERHDDMDIVQARWGYLEYWDIIHRSSGFFQNNHQKQVSMVTNPSHLGVPGTYIVLTI